MTLFFVLNVGLKCQSINRNSVLNYNYFKHNYKYLDKDFLIVIDSELFKCAVDSFGFFSDKIRKYKDSLFVIMKLEFNSNEMALCATHKIGYSWERLAYHLWISPHEAKNIGKRIGENHPYLVKEKIISSQNDAFISSIIRQLNKKIKVTYPSQDLPTDDVKAFLNYALKLNPQRIADYETLRKQKSCGCKNCTCK